MIDEKLMAGSGFGEKCRRDRDLGKNAGGIGIWGKMQAGCGISDPR